MFLKVWGIVFNTGYNAHPRNSKRMLLGLLQNLETHHPRQERLSPAGCHSLLSSNELLLGAALSSWLLRLFLCAIGTTIVVGGMLPSLDTFGHDSCSVGSAFRFFLCRLFLHLQHGLGPMAVM